MGVVMILCPRSGQKVSTGVEFSEREFNALPPSKHMTMRCWMCGGDHEWSSRWATYVDDEREIARIRSAYAH